MLQLNFYGAKYHFSFLASIYLFNIYLALPKSQACASTVIMRERLE